MDTTIGRVLVLALDTSTPVLTAGVVELAEELAGTLTEGAAGAPKLLAEESLTDPFAHAEQLVPLLQQALSTAGRSLQEASAVVVGLGPGPFTGLRVGIASAAAIGDGLGIPVYGFGSHDAFAASAGTGALTGSLLVVTDARRKEVYVSAFRHGSRIAGPQPVRPAALGDWLGDLGFVPTQLIGPGAALVADLLALPIAPANRSLSLALVSLATSDIRAKAVPEPLLPLYLRRPDATEPSAVRKSVLGR